MTQGGETSTVVDVAVTVLVWVNVLLETTVTTLVDVTVVLEPASYTVVDARTTVKPTKSPSNAILTFNGALRRVAASI